MNAMACAVLLLSCCVHAEVTFVEKGLSYDDVLLVPQKSSVVSRKSINTKTRLSKNIALNMPIISANMDTVTESCMAIAMAQLGGIGIIHRFNTIEDQVLEVKKVKRYRNAVIKDPVTILQECTVSEAYMLMQDHAISGLLVVDADHTLVGIITSRDMRSGVGKECCVKELMTPRNKLIVGSCDTTNEQAKQLLSEHRIEKLPLVYADGTIAGLITSKDIEAKLNYPSASVDMNGQLLVGAAIGVKEDAVARAGALVEAGVDVLVIDIAHGHSDLAITILKCVKTLYPTIDVIAGNVVTAQATRELICAGADAIKVGVGPGSICTTRITAGSGYPQLSAVMHCAHEADKYGIPVIADGGIRYAGDITKAIAAGASTVMLGSLLAGTDESPGMPFVKNGKKYKVIRGMASFGAHLGRSSNQLLKNSVTALDFVPEGVEAIVPYKGGVVECIYQLLGGLHSGMSYCGVACLDQLRGNGVFVEITASGIKESHPHDVEQVVH